MKASTFQFACQVAAMFKEAALAGRRGPSNGMIAERLKLQSGGFMSRLVAIAEQQGMIVVHRGNCTRVVSAPDGSWRTAGEITNAHWRDRPADRKRARNKNGTSVKRDSMRGAATLMARRAAQDASPPTPPPAPLPKPQFRMPVGISWAVDKRGCRWPMWAHQERATQVFCDAPRVDCRPYCRAHVEKATASRAAAA